MTPYSCQMRLKGQFGSEFICNDATSCRRESSRDTLVGKPNGTFLVRPKGVAPDEVPASEPLHCHTIDIV